VLAGIVVFGIFFPFYDRFYDKSDSAELIAERRRAVREGSGQFRLAGVATERGGGLEAWM
jgi:hypothetical protein